MDTSEQQSKQGRGRPPKRPEDTHPSRIVFMADGEARKWLDWRVAETGAPVSEIMRRALAAYMVANPKPKPAKRQPKPVVAVDTPAEPEQPQAEPAEPPAAAE